MIYHFFKALLCCSIVWCSCITREPSATCLFTEKLTNNFMPTITNGFVGTVVLSDKIHVGGLYNGRANTRPNFLFEPHTSNDNKGIRNSNMHTHRARIPSTVAVKFKLNISGKSTAALDVQANVFYQWFDSLSVNIEQRVYAHQEIRNVLVNEITVNATQNLIMHFETNKGVPSEDITFRHIKLNETSPYNAEEGEIKETEIENVTKTSVAVVWSKVPKAVEIKKNTKRLFVFITSIVTSIETAETLKDAVMFWEKAQNLGEGLFQAHQKRKIQAFNGFCIEVEGNLFLAQVINSALSSLFSSVREDWEFGLSPGGLAPSDEYLGHVFWDQDIWMAPSFLIFNPDLAKILLNYRSKRLNAAQDIARKYNFKGAMFPWESAFTGFEVCPEEKYGRNEIHITGDIVFSIRQYFYATADLNWIFKNGIPVVFNAADFWLSRVTFNNTLKLYVINDVMPPDEYQYPVKNSVYTNVIAKICLEFAIELGKIFQIKTPPDWEDVVTKMYIPFDKMLKYHPEFDGFDIKKPLNVVKQADVILLNFPLMYPMENDVRENDLLFYENITDLNGPAMTHSMFAIGWLEVGNRVAAEKAFKRNFENIQEPFKVWTEIRKGEGASNFLTGAGGFLQTVIFGYAGIRLRNFSLDFNLNLLPESTSLLLKGVKYRGNSLTFSVNGNNKCFVELVKASDTRLFCLLNGERMPLKVGLRIVACIGSIVPHSKRFLYKTS